MFLRITPMKKLLKEAYKQNRLLIVHNVSGCIPDGYLISNRSSWVVWVENNCMTKEFLAALIELVGTLPAAGTLYVEGKDGKITVEDDVSLEGAAGNLYEKFIFPIRDEKYELFYKTNLILVQSLANARVLQSDTGEITLINNFVTTLVNPAAIDDEIGEFECIGPARIKETHWQMWSSGKCMFAIGERYASEQHPEEKELLDLLQTMDMCGGGKADE